MPKIFPFQGWRYNPGQVSDFSSVIAPPYDVITPEIQNRLYARSQYNFVRLILNKAFFNLIQRVLVSIKNKPNFS